MPDYDATQTQLIESEFRVSAFNGSLCVSYAAMEFEADLGFYGTVDNLLFAS